jgi:hypothetical protein
LSDPKSGSATDNKTATDDKKVADDKVVTDNKTARSTAKISIDQALAELETKNAELKAAKDTIADLSTQLKATNDVLEAQAKAKLIGEIMPRSNFTVEDLSAKDLEELEHIKLTLDQAKLPTYKNIHFGPVGVDEEGNKGLTAHRDLRPQIDQRKPGRA